MPAGENSNLGDTEGVFATLQPEEETEPEMDLPSIQQRDEDLATIIEYLETGILPSNDKVARTLVLSKSQYGLEDDVLYKVEHPASDSTQGSAGTAFQRCPWRSVWGAPE